MSDFQSKSNQWPDRILRVDYADPEQARRGRLLNVLLIGSGVAVIVGMVVVALVVLLRGRFSPGDVLVAISGTVSVLLIVSLYWLNRSRSPRAAAILFVLGLIVILSFSDEPQQVVAGRTTLALVLPIIMASVLIAPAASFVVAGLVGLALSGLAVISGLSAGPLLLETIEFLLIALVGWLAARSLENALAELQTINRELDRRVAERTQDLAGALSQVQAESGKNRAILESIADGVIVFDELGQATVVNPAISRLLDLPALQILGRRPEELMVETVNAAEQKEIAARFSDALRQNTAFTLRWAKKTLSANFAPVYIDNSQQRGVVGVFRDVTREAELDRMKSLFVSMVSHELRTPINAILGYSEMLQARVYGPLTDKQVNLVERLMTNIQRLLGLVNDLLDRAQLEAGQLSLQQVEFSVAKLLDDSHAVVANLARAKGLEVTTHAAADLPDRLEGDPRRLGQILINLIGNAIKFTDRGTISIRLTRPDAAHWALEVADTGSGIPLDEQERVFDWFHQVNRSAAREHTGVGLGLSIVKQLVNLMAGEMKLQSQMGEGSTFTVVLPLSLVQEKAA